MCVINRRFHCYGNRSALNEAQHWLIANSVETWKNLSKFCDDFVVNVWLFFSHTYWAAWRSFDGRLRFSSDSHRTCNECVADKRIKEPEEEEVEEEKTHLAKNARWILRKRNGEKSTEERLSQKRKSVEIKVLYLDSQWVRSMCCTWQLEMDIPRFQASAHMPWSRSHSHHMCHRLARHCSTRIHTHSICLSAKSVCANICLAAESLVSLTIRLFAT